MPTLLERIAVLAPNAGKPLPTTQDSILEHLRDVLNTRIGDVPIRADYGMAPLDETMSRSGAQGIVVAIRELVELFEPRLLPPIEVVNVGKAGPFVLRVEVSGRVAQGRERIRIRYETVLDSMGKVDVR